AALLSRPLLAGACRARRRGRWSLWQACRDPSHGLPRLASCSSVDNVDAGDHTRLLMLATPKPSIVRPLLAAAVVAVALVAGLACNHSDAGTPPGPSTQALSEVG